MLTSCGRFRCCYYYRCCFWYIFCRLFMFWWLSILLLDKVSSFPVAYIFTVIADVDIFAVVPVVATIFVAAVVIPFAVCLCLMFLYSADPFMLCFSNTYQAGNDGQKTAASSRYRWTVTSSSWLPGRKKIQQLERLGLFSSLRLYTLNCCCLYCCCRSWCWHFAVVSVVAAIVVAAVIVVVAIVHILMALYSADHFMLCSP